MRVARTVGVPTTSGYHLVRRRLPLCCTLFLLALAGVSSGCSSNKISISPPVAMATVPPGNTVVYNVERVTLDFDGVPYGDWKKNGFGNQFTRLAEERYPTLFNKDQSAVPISVRVDAIVEPDDAAALAGFLGTLGILGGFFPSLPWTSDLELTIRAEDSRGAPILSTGFQGEHRGWWSLFSPFGLVTIPGDSDAPKVSRIFDAGPGSVPKPFRAYIVQCSVDMLAAELLKYDPTTPSLRPIGAGMPPLSPIQPGVPTALPPPKDSATPF